MILIDTNVLLDVVQKREPHYRASAAVLDLVIRGRVTAALAGHAITTIHYLVARYQDRQMANRVVDWLLRYFDVVSVGHEEMRQARVLGWSDFEDAVVAAAAHAADCRALVTRNVNDFPDSPVPVLTPDEFLLQGDDWVHEP